MPKKIKITEITKKHILFSDGSEIPICTYSDFHGYFQYTDFEGMDEDDKKEIMKVDFVLPLEFQEDGEGFLFGNNELYDNNTKWKMFYVPCKAVTNEYWISVHPNNTVRHDVIYRHPKEKTDRAFFTVDCEIKYVQAEDIPWNLEH